MCKPTWEINKESKDLITKEKKNDDFRMSYRHASWARKLKAA
jgi:hypothetical protein